MFSTLAKIPNAYLCCAIVVLICSGFVLKGLKPQIMMMSAAGQLAVGLSQIILGLIILTLTFIVVRKVRS